MDRNVNVIKDVNGNNIVVINDIRFKGKRQVDWNDVKEYLEQYVGEFYEIADTKDVVYIGGDLPDEYTGSKYTYSLKGANAKAKANAAQGIPEMLEIAIGKRYEENKEDKHQWKTLSLRCFRNKKRNEQPFGILRFYLEKTHFSLNYSIKELMLRQVSFTQLLHQCQEERAPALTKFCQSGTIGLSD